MFAKHNLFKGEFHFIPRDERVRVREKNEETLIFVMWESMRLWASQSQLVKLRTTTRHDRASKKKKNVKKSR